MHLPPFRAEGVRPHLIYAHDVLGFKIMQNFGMGPRDNPAGRASTAMSIAMALTSANLMWV
jgi:hypothetical protein